VSQHILNRWYKANLAGSARSKRPTLLKAYTRAKH
jgi:hypothetical protein